MSDLPALIVIAGVSFAAGALCSLALDAINLRRWRDNKRRHRQQRPATRIDSDTPPRFEDYNS